MQASAAPAPAPPPPAASSTPWVEKYRPSRFHDIVLDPLNRDIFQQMLTKDYFPHLLFYGPPGTGKTTSIINLINEYQTRHSVRSRSTIIHLNASDERGIDVIRNQIYQFAKTMNMFDAGLKFVILDEVDYMTKNAQQALKYILQTSNYNVRFCLVCNYITKIDESLKNEFICIRFNQLPREDVHRFLRKISDNEPALGGKVTDETLYAIQDTYHSDIRSMINFIQLHQHTIVANDVAILGDSALKDIRAMLCNAPPSSLDAFLASMQRYCIQYNTDKASIVEKWLNYMVRHHIDELLADDKLARMGVVLHAPHIPVDHVLEYIYHVFAPSPPIPVKN